MNSFKKTLEIINKIIKKKYNFERNEQFNSLMNDLYRLNTKFSNNPSINNKKNLNISQSEMNSINNIIMLSDEKYGYYLNNIEKFIELINKYEFSEVDKYPAIIQIKSGAGAEEAGIFVNDIYQSYCKFLKLKNIKHEIISQSVFECPKQSYREISFIIDSKNMFGVFKGETGVHRVQRVPITENSDRIHTSTIAISIVPFLKISNDMSIPKSDLKIESCRSSGAGGQHVNTTDSAARVTHIPTGIVVNIQNQRSYHDNLAFALNLINIKVAESLSSDNIKNIGEIKKNQVKNIDRNEKIRTYNYIRHQITDHRFEYKMNFNDFFEGKLSKNFDFFSEIIKICYIYDLITKIYL